MLNTRITALTRGPGARIIAAQTADGGAVAARLWVDASYEGFLLPLANVSFAYGREPNTTYGESIAGVLPVPHPVWELDHPFVAQPQVWRGVKGRSSTGALLPGVSTTPPGPVGSGDDAIQAYAYRTTFTSNSTNMLRPWPRPINYDPALYEIVLNGIAFYNKSSFESVIFFGGLLPCVPVPPATTCERTKGDCNNHALGQFYLSRPYPPAVAAGDWAAQEAVWQAHRDAQLGLYYFLANDPSVPQSIRDSSSAFGLPLDEHVACGHFPCQLYVREALRMRSDFVLTQHDIFDDVSQPDSVGRGAYSVDVMHAALFFTLAGDGSEVLTVEAGMQAPSFLNKTIVPFQVPLRALLPRAAEATNLLVPVALSSSHVGFNAVRLEPTWMTLGESAGVAAAMAAAADVDVQHLSVTQLQARLWQLGQVL
jgi:FAD dependent oxidoreductase